MLKPDGRLVARGWKPALYYSADANLIIRYYKDPDGLVRNPRAERVETTGYIEALEAEDLPDFESP